MGHVPLRRQADLISWFDDGGLGRIHRRQEGKGMHCSLLQPVPIARVHLLSIALCDASTATHDAAGCVLTVACPLAGTCISVHDSSSQSRAARAYQKRTVAPDRLEGHVRRAGAMHILSAPRWHASVSSDRRGRPPFRSW